MRSRARRSSAAQLSLSICTRLPGIFGLTCAAARSHHDCGRCAIARNTDAAANGRTAACRDSLFLLRHPLAFLARLRKSNRDRLRAALHLAGFAAGSAPGRSAVEAPHLSFDILAHPGGIFPFPLLRHRILLTKLLFENGGLSRSCVRGAATDSAWF